MSPFTIGVGSPEQAWEPFMAWLRSQGLDPHLIRDITIDPAAMTAQATTRKHRGEAFTKTRSINLTSLPPRRPQRDQRH